MIVEIEERFNLINPNIMHTVIIGMLFISKSHSVITNPSIPFYSTFTSVLYHRIQFVYICMVFNLNNIISTMSIISTYLRLHQ